MRQGRTANVKWEKPSGERSVGRRGGKGCGERGLENAVVVVVVMTYAGVVVINKAVAETVEVVAVVEVVVVVVMTMRVVVIAEFVVVVAIMITVAQVAVVVVVVVITVVECSFRWFFLDRILNENKFQITDENTVQRVLFIYFFLT